MRKEKGGAPRCSKSKRKELSVRLLLGEDRGKKEGTQGSSSSCSAVSEEGIFRPRLVEKEGRCVNSCNGAVERRGKPTAKGRADLKDPSHFLRKGVTRGEWLRSLEKRASRFVSRERHSSLLTER